MIAAHPDDATGAAVESWPPGVTDPLCPREHVITTPMDHRLLWHLEGELSVPAPDAARLAELAHDLRRYLNATCDHHWHDSQAYDGEPLRQCLWCNAVEWDADE